MSTGSRHLCNARITLESRPQTGHEILRAVQARDDLANGPKDVLSQAMPDWFLAATVGEIVLTTGVHHVEAAIVGTLVVFFDGARLCLLRIILHSDHLAFNGII